MQHTKNNLGSMIHRQLQLLKNFNSQYFFSKFYTLIRKYHIHHGSTTTLLTQEIIRNCKIHSRTIYNNNGKLKMSHIIVAMKELSKKRIDSKYPVRHSNEQS